MTNTVYKAPGPFSRIKAIHFEPLIRFSFRIIRDDSYEFTPNDNENISLTMESQTMELLFQGETQQTLSYSEGVTGLVKSYRYENGFYLVELDPLIMENSYSMTQKNMVCYLTTNGAETLTTTYNRAYHTEAPSTLIKPGSYTITVPYWRKTSVSTQISFDTLQKTTTIYSSVPYRAEFAFVDGQALGYFTFEVLGIVWRPTSDLLAWHGLYDIRDVCPTGTVYAPWQYPPGVNQPTQTPSSIYDRIYEIHNDVILKVSLSPCTDMWSEISVDFNSDFGFSKQIGYISPQSELVNLNHPISDFAKKMDGKSFTLTSQIQWNQASFSYSTGENPIYSNQTATLLASPAVDFDSLSFQPLPE
ncbi:MAG: hypothetical protein HQL68_05590 [Magnetococcales bacterium]|nr:hypothetical protein [Magnetococcales bacterium]